MSIQGKTKRINLEAKVKQHLTNGTLSKHLPQLLQEDFNLETYYKWKDIPGRDRRFTPLQISCYQGSVSDVKALIHAGADVSHTTEIEGSTALMMPFKKNSSEIIQCLVQAGADVNEQRTSDDAAALHFAERRLRFLNRIGLPDPRVQPASRNLRQQSGQPLPRFVGIAPAMFAEHSANDAVVLH